MRVRAWPVAFLFSTSLAASAAPGTRGTVVVSGDAPGVGRLQQLLEQRLAQSGLTVRGPIELSDSAVTLGAPVPADAATQERIRQIFATVEKAFGEARFDDAIAAFSKMPANASASDTGLMLFWEAAIELKRGNEITAESDARNALLAAGELDVPGTFPPSVLQLFNTTKSGMKQAAVTVDAYPPSAKVVLDERVLPLSFQAWVGRHKLRVIAPGYRPSEQTIEITESPAPVTIQVALAPALKAPVDAMLTSLMSRAELSDADAKILEQLAARDGSSDVVVAAIVRADATRAAVWVRGAKPQKRNFTGAPSIIDATVADWAASVLRDSRTATVATAVTTPPPARRPQTPRATTPGLSTWVDAGLGFANRQRALSGKTAETGGMTWAKGLNLNYAGPAPALEAGVEYSGILAQVDLAFATYALSPIRTNSPTNSNVSIDGGNSLFARVGAGYRFHFGERRDAGTPFVGGRLAADVESYMSAKLAGSPASFPSHNRISPQLWVEGGAPIGAGALSGGLAFEPGGSYSETPSGASGLSPAVSGLGGRLDASWPVGERWTLGGRYELMRRTITFKGVAAPDYSPKLYNAHVTDTSHFATVVVERRF